MAMAEKGGAVIDFPPFVGAFKYAGDSNLKEIKFHRTKQTNVGNTKIHFIPMPIYINT